MAARLRHVPALQWTASLAEIVTAGETLAHRCGSGLELKPSDTTPNEVGMPHRVSRLTAAAGLCVVAAVPSLARAQRGGGQQGPDNRPEVQFKVDLPADDARLAALKK